MCSFGFINYVENWYQTISQVPTDHVVLKMVNCNNELI